MLAPATATAARSHRRGFFSTVHSTHTAEERDARSSTPRAPLAPPTARELAFHGKNFTSTSRISLYHTHTYCMYHNGKFVAAGRRRSLGAVGAFMRHRRMPEEEPVDDRTELTRRVTRSSLVNSAVAAISLLAVLASQNSTVQGWAAAVGAALVFGGSSLPAKHPAASAAGALGFQVWVTLGNAALNFLLLLLLRVPLVWDIHGVVGAMCLTATQLFAWPAIQRLGAAAGPGIWCGIGMITAFGWGVLGFDEELRSPVLAGFALVTLVVGVAGVAASQLIAGRAAAAAAAARAASSSVLPRSTDTMTTPDASPARERARNKPFASSAALIGVVCALATGGLDGSLMAPFSAYRASANARDTEVALRYLGSFALALPLVALLPLLITSAMRAVLAWRRHGAVRRAKVAGVLEWPCAVCGLASGAMWAAANVLSVHATMRLGQAIGFPLTQCCVIVSSLWGILYFGELRDRAALGVFTGSSVLMLVGAATLKQAGVGFT